MLCQHCKKKPASVNYYEVVDGNKFECHLCSFCYAGLYGELNDKLNHGKWANLFGVDSCPVCGATYADYERTGLLGCAGCYDVFHEKLIPVIRGIQGKTEHVGKVGKNADNFGLRIQLKNLQEKLEDALREKNFREADRLNRQINAIKKSLHGGGNG